MEKSVPFGSLTQSLTTDLKSSSSLWESACSKATKLSTQLASSATAFGEFIDAIQAISDSANSVKGATKDVGATLTRFCLRQRRLQSKLRTLAAALTDQFSAPLGRRSLQWRQRIGEIEKRSRKRQQKQRSKARGIVNARKVSGSEDDDLVAERGFCEELLLERRQQCISFLSLLHQLTNLEVDLLDEGEQLRQLRDSMEIIIGGDDPRQLVDILLDDIYSADVSRSTCATYSSREEEVLRQYSQPSAALPRAVSAVSTSAYGSSLFTEFGGTPTTEHQFVYWHAKDNGLPMTKASTIGTATGYGVGERKHAPIPPALMNHHAVTQAVAPLQVASACVMVRSHDGQYPLSSRITNNGRPPIPPSPRLRIPPAPSHHQSFPLGYSTTAGPPSSYNLQLAPRQTDNCRLGQGTLQLQLRHSTILSSSVNDLRQPAINYRPQSLASAAGRRRVPNSRPLSLTEGCDHRSLLPAANLQTEQCDAESRASSSALIAETLEQIDKLGDELDSFCRTLKPIGRTVKVADNSSSGMGSSNASLEAAPPLSLHNQQQQMLNDTTVRYRPNYIQLPPPIPERRNSTITAATPTAPSIAELRGSVNEVDQHCLHY